MVIAPTRLDLFILGSKTMPGLLQRFLPRDDDYFELFARQAENIQKGARALCDMLSRYTAVNEQVQSIKAIEHAGDEIAHTIITEVLANNQAENGVLIDPTETSTYTGESLK